MALYTVLYVTLYTTVYRTVCGTLITLYNSTWHCTHHSDCTQLHKALYIALYITLYTPLYLFWDLYLVTNLAKQIPRNIFNIICLPCWTDKEFELLWLCHLLNIGITPVYQLGRSKSCIPHWRGRAGNYIFSGRRSSTLPHRCAPDFSPGPWRMWKSWRWLIVLSMGKKTQSVTWGTSTLIGKGRLGYRQIFTVWTDWISSCEKP